jgi:hypothetical protein
MKYSLNCVFKQYLKKIKGERKGKGKVQKEN